MMSASSLPLAQTAPQQTGLAAILAALGPATPVGTDEGGFEQLFASLPATAAPATLSAPAASSPFTFQAPVVPGAPVPATPAAAPLPDAALLPAPAAPVPPAVALFGMPQPATGATPQPAVQAGIATAPAAGVPIEAAAPVETAKNTPMVVAAAPEAKPADEAAAAATLLIAVATPFKGTPAGKPAPAASAETNAPADGEPASPAVEDAATPAMPAAAIVADAPAPIAAPAIVVAANIPAADKPVAEKTAKSITLTVAAHSGESAASAVPAPVAAKAAETAAPLPGFAPATVETKAAKPAADAGASMAVLFAQPDPQGAATVAGAAKTAPLAERILDTSSDDQWIAQLAADIAATKSDKGDISFRLMPRHLGRLDVAMLTGDAGVTLKLDTQHEATATIVTAAQPRLVEDLRQQGVRVAGAEVTCTPGETGRQQQQGQGRTAAPDTAHLIETATERTETTSDERTAGRRGRFA